MTNAVNSSGSGLFARQGGKFTSQKRIIKRFPPVGEYDTYVEPFLGGGSIALNAPIVKHMYASDTDTFVIDTFKIVKRLPVDVIRDIDFKIKNKPEFEKLKLYKPTNDVEKLRKNISLTMSSFLSKRQTFTGKNNKGGVVFKRQLERVKDTLSHYKIMKKPYQYMISKYDSERTFFYLDPPYHNTDTAIYETGNINHEELADMLRHIKGLFLLSHNDTPYIRNLYKGFHFHKIQTHQVKEKTPHVIVNEVLISNYTSSG